MHLYLTYVLFFTLSVASFAFGIDRLLDRMDKRNPPKDDRKADAAEQ